MYCTDCSCTLKIVNVTCILFMDCTDWTCTVQIVHLLYILFVYCTYYLCTVNTVCVLYVYYTDCTCTIQIVLYILYVYSADFTCTVQIFLVYTVQSVRVLSRLFVYCTDFFWVKKTLPRQLSSSLVMIRVSTFIGTVLI